MWCGVGVIDVNTSLCRGSVVKGDTVLLKMPNNVHFSLATTTTKTKQQTALLLRRVNKQFSPKFQGHAVLA